MLFYSSSNDSSSSKTSMSCGLLPHAWQCHCSCKVHGAQRQHSLEATVVLVSYVTKLQPAWKATGTACRCNFLHYTITEAATAVIAATIAVTTLPLRHAGQGGPAALYQDSFSTNRVRATATWVLLTSMCMCKQQQWARSCCLFAALVGVFVLCQHLAGASAASLNPMRPVTNSHMIDQEQDIMMVGSHVASHIVPINCRTVAGGLLAVPMLLLPCLVTGFVLSGATCSAGPTGARLTSQTCTNLSLGTVSHAARLPCTT